MIHVSSLQYETLRRLIGYFLDIEFFWTIKFIFLLVCNMGKHSGAICVKLYHYLIYCFHSFSKLVWKWPPLSVALATKCVDSCVLCDPDGRTYSWRRLWPWSEWGQNRLYVLARTLVLMRPNNDSHHLLSLRMGWGVETGSPGCCSDGRPSLQSSFTWLCWHKFSRIGGRMALFKAMVIVWSLGSIVRATTYVLWGSWELYRDFI